LKKHIAKFYNIDLKQLALKFDGNIVQDSETPESLGIEDEDLVDIQVRVVMLTNALEIKTEQLSIFFNIVA
jgi:hypothetical protein